jgi:hypothetical protein
MALFEVDDAENVAVTLTPEMAEQLAQLATAAQGLPVPASSTT